MESEMSSDMSSEITIDELWADRDKWLASAIVLERKLAKARERLRKIAEQDAPLIEAVMKMQCERDALQTKVDELALALDVRQEIAGEELDRANKWHALFEQERKKYDAAVEALAWIHGNAGNVCSGYETCDHPACASSYNSWATADKFFFAAKLAERGKA